MVYEICCIGHITLDKIVTNKGTVYMPGGTSFYFSNALAEMDVQYLLLTSLAESEMYVIEELRAKGIEVKATPSAKTLYFENIYSDDLNHRTQKVLQKAEPFTVEPLTDVSAKIFHLGPLLADDMPLDIFHVLAAKGRISLDVQGYLRKVENFQVYPIDWPFKREALSLTHYLKANEYEMEVLTGSTDVYAGAKMLSEWGVKEVIITLGSKGSVIYSDGILYTIPAYHPLCEVDTTGCGDTYMAGYLYQRIKGATIQQAGEFASAMAALKIEAAGPFTGTKEDVYALLDGNGRAIAHV